MGTKLLLGFGGAVIQVVVHLIATGSEMLSRFGSTVNQVVAHWAFTRSCWVEGFGGTVNQAVVRRRKAFRPSATRFGNTVD